MEGEGRRGRGEGCAHKHLHEAQVVLRKQNRRKWLLGLVEVMEVGRGVGQVRGDDLVVMRPLAELAQPSSRQRANQGSGAVKISAMGCLPHACAREVRTLVVGGLRGASHGK